MLSQITYLLLDAARMGETMETAKEMNPAHDSLYRGRSEESLTSVAPYIFSFQQNKTFANWYMEKGWGDSWGILIKAAYPMAELHKHFRKFLIVGTEDNQQLYFRFYDPRVLRIFLPTCDAGQLAEFFGPVDYFMMEDEDAAFAVKFWLENGQLRSGKTKLQDFVGVGIHAADVSSTGDPVQASSEEHQFIKTDFNTAGNQAASTEESAVKKPSKPKWNMLD